MAHNSEARDVLRSLLPENYLIRKRDVLALRYKYQTQLAGSWSCRFESLRWNYWGTPTPDEDLDYCAGKYFDGLALEHQEPSPVAAYDPATGASVAIDGKNIMQLHLFWLRGPEHIRTQLRTTAAYIRNHKQLLETPYVMGVSYPRLGELAVALGFREMTVREVKPDYLASIHATHLAYWATNGHDKAENKFEPMAVYLPTHEFIAKFGGGA